MHSWVSCWNSCHFAEGLCLCDTCTSSNCTADSAGSFSIQNSPLLVANAECKPPNFPVSVLPLSIDTAKYFFTKYYYLLLKCLCTGYFLIKKMEIWTNTSHTRTLLNTVVHIFTQQKLQLHSQYVIVWVALHIWERIYSKFVFLCPEGFVPLLIAQGESAGVPVCRIMPTKSETRVRAQWAGEPSFLHFLELSPKVLQTSSGYC